MKFPAASKETRIILKNKQTLLFAAIFILAFGLRLAAVVNLPPRYQQPHADAHGYNSLAVGLLEGKGLVNEETGRPTAFRTPLYPIFLALIYSVFGVNFFAVRVIQGFIGALLCIILFLIAEKAFDRNTALLSAFILAVYQPYIYYLYFGGPGFLLSENLYCFLMALFLYSVILVFFPGKNTALRLIVSGVLFGLTVLTRPEVVFFPLFTLMLIFCCRQMLRKIISLKNLSLFIAAFLLIILPWSVRNFIIFKKAIPLTTYSGYIFFCGNNQNSRGGWGRNIEPVEKKDLGDFGRLSELEQNKIYFKSAMDFIRSNYERFPKLVVRKIIVFWSIFDEGGRANIWYGPVLMFAFVGMAHLWLWRLYQPANLLLLAVFLYFTLIAMIFFGEPRYRYPIEPFIIIFASYGLLLVGEKMLKKEMLYVFVFIFIVSVNLSLYLFNDRILLIGKTIAHDVGLSW